MSEFNEINGIKETDKINKINEIRGTYTAPVTHKCDVLVCGGGIAGIAAALSACRSGADVLLLERSFLLGGLATSGLVTIFLPLDDGMGRQVSFGIAEELLRLSVKYGAEGRYPTHWLDENLSAAERAGTERYEVQFNPQLFALAAEELLLAEGVKILYGTAVTDVRVEDGRITHAVIENKSGRQAVEVLRSVVDASGDADVCKLSGARCALHERGNVLAAWYYLLSRGEYRLNMLGFCDAPGGEVQLLADRRFGGVDGDELSGMVQLSHRSMLGDFLMRRADAPDTVPVTVPTIPQVRMTRKLVGAYVLDESEVHRRFDDSVGLVSDWRTRGPVFEIPFRTLYGNEVKNLIAAGRCISVTDAMWDITRVIPDCAVTGEAAGCAAAMSDDFAAFDVALLQSELRRRGIILHESEIS